jgi:hypothetical protein
MNGFAVKGIFQRDLNVVAKISGTFRAASSRTHSEDAFEEVRKR